MLKFPLVEGNSKNQKQNNSIRKFVITENITLNSNEYLPVDYGTRGVHTTIRDDLGKPLLKAASEGNILETKSLLSKGALFTADWLGTSPLHLASQNNHVEICEILLRAGITRDARTKVDRTALHVASCEGHCSVVEVLLAYGAETASKDLLGMTPLHWAAQNGHYEVVKALLKHGAEPHPHNKFDLMPLDLAAQINRQDIVDLINMSASDSALAAENLTLQLQNESNSESIIHPIPLETVLLEDNENSIDPETLHINQTESSQDEESSKEDSNAAINEANSFDESMKLLQEHGITMLPNDDHDNILSTVMESGHSVVLTDVGKEMLNFVKESEQITLKSVPNNTTQLKQKKFITVTPEELINLTTTGRLTKANIFKQTNIKIDEPKAFKKIIMRKDRVFPISNINCVSKVCKESRPTDMETVMKQLIEARKTIEEYKVKLSKKEQEAERYKQQLKLLMEDDS